MGEEGSDDGAVDTLVFLILGGLGSELRMKRDNSVRVEDNLRSVR